MRIGAPRQLRHMIEIRVPDKGAVDYVNVKGIAGCLPVRDGKIIVQIEGGPKYLHIGTASKYGPQACRRQYMAAGKKSG